MKNHSATLAWLAAFVGLNAAHFVFLFGGADRIVFCCDGYMYIEGANRLVTDGLLAETNLPGYRSILNYVL